MDEAHASWEGIKTVEKDPHMILEAFHVQNDICSDIFVGIIVVDAQFLSNLLHPW